MTLPVDLLLVLNIRTAIYLEISWSQRRDSSLLILKLSSTTPTSSTIAARCEIWLCCNHRSSSLNPTKQTLWGRDRPKTEIVTFLGITRSNLSLRLHKFQMSAMFTLCQTTIIVRFSREIRVEWVTGANNTRCLSWVLNGINGTL